ncbi:hypothetical protein [Bosea sp. BK604]|uniref:hypothetical protein n=1 Tax=Bosea sp. BK604 TaxID=2512180 RepID=UPI001051AA51|nr:hypothetical protein [Bosea sp. BK604]TCR65439.1 hypothetical protein EV560_105202 [Bosea sp. BK604]
MADGLIVYNEFNTVQIDETWRNMGFREKRSVSVSVAATSPPVPAGYGGQPMAITVSGGEEVLVACRASALHPVMLHSYFDGGTWTFNWMFITNLVGEAVTETVDFYVFDILTGSYSDFGLKVYDASSRLVFDSSAPIIKAVRFLGCDTGFTGAPGRTYAPLIMRAPFFGVNLGLPAGNRLFAHCLRSSGNSITSAVKSLGAFGASGAYGNVGEYAVIDVTGY